MVLSPTWFRWKPSRGEVKRSVEVSIDGKPFTFRSDADQAYLDELAAYFEECFKEVRSSRGRNPFNQAVLAALNITEELFRERSRIAELKDQVKARCERIEDLIDRFEAAAEKQRRG